MKSKENDTLISIGLIVIYVFLNSFCINKFSVLSYKTTIINFIFLLCLILFVKKKGLLNYYGFVKVSKYKEFLYYIPLIIISTVNLWNGFNINNTFSEILFYILTMFCVGFLEELLFRGFLFRMIEKENVNCAIIISSLTFGLGHIINLINGASLIPTLIQICYAVVLGYLFVTIFHKGGSIYPCCISHAVINATAIFSINNNISFYIAPIIIFVVAILYSLYINYKVR